MKSIHVTFLFILGLILAPDWLNASIPYKEKPSSVIEKIERKYEEIRKTAPSIKTNNVSVKTIRFIQESDNLLPDYSKLHQIVLIRHGEPDINKCGKFTCDEANQFLKCYDSVCIVVPEKPFFQLEENEQVALFSSPLNRALSTANYICGTNKCITVLPEFREFENKISSSDFQKRRSIKKWTTISRLKWMLGRGKNEDIESFSKAKDRARKAANILSDASKDNSKVLLTAHGMLNRYIKKNLKKMGWKVVADTGSDYFGTTILVKVE